MFEDSESIETFVREMAPPVVVEDVFTAGQLDEGFQAPVRVAYARDGYTATKFDLQDLMPYERRAKGTVAFVDPASWLAYVDRYWNNEAIVFADETKVTAIFNHHPSDDALGGRNDWRAVLQLAPTPSWTAWALNQQTWMTQEELANFLELHATDVVDPPAAEVLESILDVRAHLSANFRKGVNLRNGTIQLEYVEELTDRGSANTTAGQFSIPAKLKLRLRRWQGNFEPVEIEALVRFVLREGQLKLMYVYPATVAQAAQEQWEKVLDELRTRLGAEKPVHMGGITS